MNLLHVVKKNWSILLLTALVLWMFRTLVLNARTDLLDLGDYPFVVWTHFQQIHRLLAGDFAHIFSGNIYYPAQDTLFFSDLQLPQTVLVLIAYILTGERILAFNLMMIVTMLANVFASRYLWRAVTKNESILFFAGLMTVISPFVLTQLGHAQMLTFWPSLCAIGIVLRSVHTRTRRGAALLGIVLAVQFVANVYHAVFALTMVMLFVGVQLLRMALLRRIDRQLMVWFCGSAVIFTVLVLPFFIQFRRVQQRYQIARQDGEYTYYAAHLSDYVFTGAYHSVLSGVMTGWNAFNHHLHGERAGFPTVSVITFAVIGTWSIVRSKKTWLIGIKGSTVRVFFLTLVLVSGIFSLGPRLNVNGEFINIPLPYYFFYKVIPLFEPIRSTARWSFVFTLGLVGLAVLGMTKLQHLRVFRVVMIGCILLYLLEIFPVRLTSERVPESTMLGVLQPLCPSPDTVLLEYPVRFDNDPVMAKRQLPYFSLMMLESLDHRCYLVNGYSGFVPPASAAFFAELDAAIAQQETKTVFELLDSFDVQVLRTHHALLSPSQRVALAHILQGHDRVKVVLDSESESIYQVIPAATAP